MAVWSRTRAEIQQHIESTVRAMRKGIAVITHQDRAAIIAAINEALVDISMERSIDVPKTVMSDATVDTVADQNYVDLGSSVIKVVDGSVRIPSEDCVLTPMTISEFYAIDPGEDSSAPFPTQYAIDTDGSGVLRLLLRDTPDSVKTIYLKVESMPDENDVSALPGWYHGLLRSLATAITLETLGLPASGIHQGRYNERLKNIREMQRGRSGPQHVQIQEIDYKPRAPELRISGGSA